MKKKKIKIVQISFNDVYFSDFVCGEKPLEKQWKFVWTKFNSDYFCCEIYLLKYGGLGKFLLKSHTFLFLCGRAFLE